MRQGLRLDLCIPPEWARIDAIREAVGLFVAAVFGDGELRESLPMVSAELLENAIKYGKLDGTGVRYSLREDDNEVVISVSNAIEPGAAQVRALAAHVAWVGSFAEPVAAYQAALARLYDQEDRPEGESGLGLVRIAYEGGCRVECDTTEPGRVTLRAIRALPELAEATA